ncbi:MAG TPA: three-Cys-motif partner protein TcmP [Rhizomicrobium sp.]|jgi:three-Cys-motif partner protein|nr:three-Cys-motif partner protein TcmP [Rhizomicrobium sp.]
MSDPADPYSDREQTKAKHYILKHYLQVLAFKVLNFSDVTYVDGFSGPWETQTEDHSDSSFVIALTVLQDAQQKLAARNIRRRIRCFFSETNTAAYAQLRAAVAPFHKPAENFEIKTYHGEFENAVEEIAGFIGQSLPLIFIDPTGWTGYPLAKLKPLFSRPKCEVLINFMYEFINRFAYSDDPKHIASLDPILGGPGWRNRLDKDLARGSAVEKLFRDTIETTLNLPFVVSTRIDKSTAERPHFFITYGSKHREGLKVFRDIEYSALREHEKSRADASERKRAEKTGSDDLFAQHHAEVRKATIDGIVEENKGRAKARLLAALAHGPVKFVQVVDDLLKGFMLRETNVKDICVALAKDGKIENTWGGGTRKPADASIIKLANVAGS